MYVPYFDSDSCVTIYNPDIIRVYSESPVAEKSINYTDYLLNSHYISYTGVSYFTSDDPLPTCITDLNDNFYNRVDILDIVLLFSIFVIFNWFLISKLFKTLLHGGKRL